MVVEEQGVLNSPQPPMAPEATMPAEAPTGESPQVSDINKEKVSEYVSAGMNLIHSEETSKRVINMLKSGGTPIQSLSKVSLQVVEMLNAEAKKSGKEYGDEIVMAGATFLIPQLVEVGEASGAFPKELNDEEIKMATGEAVSEYIKKRVDSGEITKEQLMQMNAEIDKQATMEGNGKSTEAPPAMQSMLSEQGQEQGAQ